MYPYDPLTILRHCKPPIVDATLRSKLQSVTGQASYAMLTKKLLSQGELFDGGFINAGVCDYRGQTMKNSLYTDGEDACLLAMY